MNADSKAEANAAAEAGDIDMLYRVIQADPRVLEKIEEIPFVDTPLHFVAASEHITFPTDIRFATEIIRLKPSFTRKLNTEGLSPMHLALRNSNKSMVLRLVSIDKDVVRVKGKKGVTPLHYVTEIGEIDLLAEFLKACPESIEDLTVEGQTALHIAVEKGQFQALQLMVGWLEGDRHLIDDNIEGSILNSKNDSGDTILHISARKNDSQMAKLLIDNKINLNAKNLKGDTALDIVQEHGTAVDNHDIKNMLLSAGALVRSTGPSAPSLAVGPMSSITTTEWDLRNITEGTRSAMLVVAVLVATTTYQAALSPPGGVYQSDTKSNSSSDDPNHLKGKSIMVPKDFVWFWIVNSAALLASSWIIYHLLPSKRVRNILMGPLFYFVFCYLYAMRVISPSRVLSYCNIVMLLLTFGLLLWIYAPLVRAFVLTVTGKMRKLSICLDEEIDGS